MVTFNYTVSDIFNVNVFTLNDSIRWSVDIHIICVGKISVFRTDAYS